MMWFWLSKKFLTPKNFYFTTLKILPFLYFAFFATFTYGVIDGLFFAPADYQQGDAFRIVYVHVPSAFLGMAAYLVMAISAFMVLVWRIKIAAISMISSARIGVWFTFLALVTGSIWGKPMWGTWWVWDARLTSMLILLFLYWGFLALQAMPMTLEARDKASAILALCGVINLPIIHYSVLWWNTLHQGPTLSKFAKPSMAPAMLYPLLSMIAAFFLFYGITLILRMQNEILRREWKSPWVREIL